MHCRWVCTSGDPGDLDTTDEIATSVLEDIINKGGILIVYFLDFFFNLDDSYLLYLIFTTKRHAVKIVTDI